MKIKYLILPVFVLFVISGAFTTVSCKKSEVVKQNSDTTSVVDDTASYVEKIFAIYVLNQPIRIILAVDSAGENVTQKYSEMQIYLRKETYYKGPLEIITNGTKYVGRWSTDADYYLLDFEIEGIPEFEFFKKTWRFTYKSFDLLIIAPYKKPGKKTLHLEKI